MPAWLQPAPLSPSLRKNPAERLSYLELMVSAGTAVGWWGSGENATSLCTEMAAPLACLCSNSFGHSVVHSDIAWLPPLSSTPGPVEGHTGSAPSDGAEGWGGG